MGEGLYMPTSLHGSSVHGQRAPPLPAKRGEVTEFAARADHDFTPPVMSSTSFCGVTGVCAMRTPKGLSASSMAEITAAAVGMVETSPAPLAPSGLSGDGVSR